MMANVSLVLTFLVPFSPPGFAIVMFVRIVLILSSTTYMYHKRPCPVTYLFVRASHIG